MSARGGRPRWRHLVAAALAAGLAVSVAACGPSGDAATTTSSTLVPVLGGALTVGIDEAPTTCNPNLTSRSSWASRTVLAAVLPGAFSVDPTGASNGNSYVVDQAEVVSTKPQTIVYTIDPRATWSDGVPITAADFRYAWLEQRGTDQVTGLPAVQDASVLGYRDIKSLTASNHGKTVTVVLKEPDADWKAMFDELLPAHVMEKVGWDPGCTDVDPSVDLSGGPFEIASVEPGQVVLRPNPEWWGPPPLLHQVTVRVASGPSELASWLDQGVVQVASPGDVDREFVQEAVNGPRTQSELALSATIVQLEFAVNGPETGTVDLREAIAHAVDRQSLVSSVTGWLDANVVPGQSHLYAQGQSEYPSLPWVGAAPNTFLGANEPTTTTTTNPTPGSGSPFPTTADLSATARLLNLSGYVLAPDGRWLTPTGAPMVLRLAVDDGDAWASQSGQVIAAQLERAGFGVQVVPEPNGAATGVALASGQADLAVLPRTAGPYTSQAIAWYTPSLGPPGQNGSEDWSGLDDPTVTNLLTQASQQLYPVTAQSIYAKADQQLWTDMVGLPLFAQPELLGWSVQTYGVVPNFNGANLLGTLATWQLRAPEPPGSAASSSVTTSTTTPPD